MERCDAKELKKILRKEIRAKIESLDSEYCIQADRDIFKQVTELEAYKQGKAIFCFVGTKREIDTAPIINHALSLGKQVAVPKCRSKGIMDARLIQSLSDLRVGFYGIMEPDEYAPCLGPEKVDLAIIPCLSCSSSGKRLGYGGGYYDRYLEHVTGLKAVICRRQIMRDDIPVEDHDQDVDLVICEENIWRLGENDLFVSGGNS